ncbi:MAG TPA: hypothetical protein VIN07_05025 [Flavipsychrobacter sp.]
MNKNTYAIISVVAAAVLLMWYAFYNRYPLVTGDSGAYVYFAQDFAVLKDRSSFYSIWLAITGLRTLEFAGVRGSLWAPVFFQCLLLAILFLRYYRMLGHTTPVKSIHYLLATVLVAAFTAVSSIAAFIMPDIFASVLLLAILLYLYDDKASGKICLLYLGLIGFSILVHNSHFLIVPVFCVLMLLFAQLTMQLAVRRRILYVLGVSACCWLLVCSINAIYGFGFTLSPGSHVFMAGKLVETGTMKKYLDEQCAVKQHKLCRYKDQLPEKAYQYIWADEGPFKKIGGWDSSAGEHKAVIREIFTTPKYVADFAKTALRHSWQQLQFIRIWEHGQTFDKFSAPYMSIEKHVKFELTQFTGSHQQRRTINNSTWIDVQQIVLVLSILGVGILLLRGKLPKHTTYIYTAIVIFIICNAFITASFANVLDRLQTRIFWVLPATNIFVLVNFYWQWANKRKIY